MMEVCFDGLRTNLCNEMFDVMDHIEPLVESYRKNNYDVRMDRYDARQLFDSINELRQSVGAIMCCYSEEVGMKDLSKLTDGLEFIDYDGDES